MCPSMCNSKYILGYFHPTLVHCQDTSELARVCRGGAIPDDDNIQTKWTVVNSILNANFFFLFFFFNVFKVGVATTSAPMLSKLFYASMAK